MLRRLRAIMLTLATASIVLLAAPAHAAPADGPINAFMHKVFLTNDPFAPSVVTEVEVGNSGTTALAGRFTLQLPAHLVTVDSGTCTRDAAPGTWICSAGQVEPTAHGAEKIVRVSLRSAQLVKPNFGT